IILGLIADIGVDGATYSALEFGGSAIASLSQDARFTIANMSVEAGAKAGLFAVDNITCEYISARPGSKNFNSGSDCKSAAKRFSPDDGAAYSLVLNYNANALVPVVACPYNLDNVKPAAELSDVKLDQIFLGSCTNGRLEDLAVAAKILVGKKVASNVRLLVVPASRGVYLEATRRGYIKILVDAGAQVGHPACSLCAGRSGGILENSDRILSTNNRNFHGRMGGENTEIYIASPAVAAASAVTGRITDPGSEY
ncbi:MAG: 3-isopropylmalate dehydratase large subunit, partial [Spirochaetaceae bacterium]